MHPEGDTNCNLEKPDNEDTIDTLLNYHSQSVAGAVIWDTDYGTMGGDNDHCATSLYGWNNPGYIPALGPCAGIPALIPALALMGINPYDEDQTCNIPRWALEVGEVPFGSVREMIEYIKSGHTFEPSPPLDVADVIERGVAYKPKDVAPEDMIPMRDF
tara:strand:- start:94 stop:570 length:477 start_codon:yes stop_codon:yes gene_type:complete